MLVKQELTMNLSMKCFPAQKRNYDIETLIPKMPNAAEKKSLFINFLIQFRLNYILIKMFILLRVCNLICPKCDPE